MAKLILEWQEAQDVKRYQLDTQQPSKSPGTVRLGRDPAKCDLLLQHPTVSGLHVEIFLDIQDNQFYLRNLRPSNPPIIDNQSLHQGEVPLHLGSSIYLGQLQLTVVSISSPSPPTLLLSSDSQNSPQLAYGLKCPHCDRISSYDRMTLGCQWCGTSLAAAISVLLPPE